MPQLVLDVIPRVAPYLRWNPYPGTPRRRSARAVSRIPSGCKTSPCLRTTWRTDRAAGNPQLPLTLKHFVYDEDKTLFRHHAIRSDSEAGHSDRGRGHNHHSGHPLWRRIENRARSQAGMRAWNYSVLH